MFRYQETQGFFIHTVWLVSHIVEQETDSVYGLLPPKIDSDKHVDEYFMPAMPEVSQLRGMVNLTWLMEEVLKGACIIILSSTIYRDTSCVTQIYYKNINSCKCHNIFCLFEAKVIFCWIISPTLKPFPLDTNLLKLLLLESASTGTVCEHFFLVSISTNCSSRGRNDPRWNQTEVCTAESVGFNRASCGIRLSFCCCFERYF